MTPSGDRQFFDFALADQVIELCSKGLSIDLEVQLQLGQGSLFSLIKVGLYSVQQKA